MRLTELNPRWCAAWGAPDDAKQGISFLCPHCKVVKLAVFFDVPITPHPPVAVIAERTLQAYFDQANYGHLEDHHIGAILWHREGDTFDTLTLTPSIDASRWGCWHGHIVAGEIK